MKTQRCIGCDAVLSPVVASPAWRTSLVFSAVLLALALPGAALAQANCSTTHTISAIQGNAGTQLAGGAHNDVSPLNGQRVTIAGVVVGDYQSIPQPARTGELRGFFLEEEAADQDSDPTTSEGIFVFSGSNPPLDVAEGQRICVTGQVSEFFGMTQVSATTSGSLRLMASNVPLPAPAALALPVTGDLNDYYEQYEGMRVRYASSLHVSEYFEVARYGQIVLNGGSRPFQYTHTDFTPTAGEYASFLDALARNRIILDDRDNVQNSPLPSGVFFHPQPGGLANGTQGTNYFRGGDVVDGLTGVLHWSYAGQTGTDAWRVRPTQASPVAFTVRNARPAQAPVRHGSLRVASFNVLNYFSTIDTTASSTSGPCGPSGTLDCRGADSSVEFERQNAKLVAALLALDADVFGLIEIENNGGTALTELVNRLNSAVGTTRYAAVNAGVVGSDAITVAILYNSSVVSPRGQPALLSAAAFTDPNATGQQRNRPAIAQTFQVTAAQRPDTGEAFTLVVNHFKSKSPSGASGADADQLDGQSAWNDTRTKAAQYLVNTWLPSDPTGQSEPDVLIIGDLNAYRGESPVTAIRAAGYADLHELFEGPNAYSYVFDGQLGYLDHALGNSTMAAQVAGVASWPINADEVPVFDYNDTVKDTGEATFDAEPSGNSLYEPNAARTSDHDPVLVDLNLCPAGTCLPANLARQTAVRAP
jgi:predicted extracellular nuclease